VAQGSQSSKCTEIRTPQDPDKISMIDNKRMSISIGVFGGLIVFAGIIVIIVSKHDSKENEDMPDESLAINPNKSQVASMSKNFLFFVSELFVRRFSKLVYTTAIIGLS
jgi:hypothetical protein